MSTGNQRATIYLAPGLAGNYGTLDGDNIPDRALLTFAAIEAYRTPTVTFDGQEQPAAELDIAQNGAHRYPPDVEAPWDATSAIPYRRNVGTVKVSIPVRGIGDGTTYADHTVYPLTRMLATSMDSLVPTASTDAAGSIKTTNTFEPALAGSFSVGMLCSVVLDGSVEFFRVTQVDAIGPLITYTPSTTRAINAAAGDVVHLMTTYYPTFGAPTADEVVLSVDTESERWTAYGCRLETVKFGFEGKSQVAELELRSPWIIRGTPAALVNPTLPVYAGGQRVPRAELDPTRSAVSAAVTGLAPIALARTAIQIREWDATFTANLSPAESHESGLMMSDLDVGNPELEVNVTMEPSTALDDMRRAQTLRNLVVGAGPGNVGHGMAIHLGSAFLGETELPKLEDLRTIRSPKFLPGPWDGDDGSAAGSNLPWAIGFNL